MQFRIGITASRLGISPSLGLPGLGLALALAGCSAPLPPRITVSGALPVAVSGALPAGPAVKLALIENPAGEALLPAHRVAACLAGQGLQAADGAEYMAQSTVAIRPANSALLVGAKAEGPPPAAKSGAKSGYRARGERIVYGLVIDQLSDGARVFDWSMDAPYRAKRSTPDARAAEFCAGLTRKTP